MSGSEWSVGDHGRLTVEFKVTGLTNAGKTVAIETLEPLSFLTTYPTTLVVNGDHRGLEWIKSPLPTTPGSVISAVSDGKRQMLTLIQDWDEPDWVRVSDGDSVKAHTLSDWSVLFDAGSVTE